MRRTIEYAQNGMYVLWLLQWTPRLDAKRYTPRHWERWIHAAYFGRVYYWVEGLTVVSYHFDPHFRSVPKKSWYSEDGEKMTAGGSQTAIVALQNRFKQVGGNTWTATAVGTTNELDQRNNTVFPAATARREMLEEVGLTFDETRFEWSGFGCRLDNGNYSLLAEVTTDLDFAAIKRAPKEAAENSEVEKLDPVELTPKGVLSFFTKLHRDKQQWTPFLEIALALALWRRFPDRVEF
jgi:8-oxo-dGTP pyrophosphatase MutT (NUDIX family)